MISCCDYFVTNQVLWSARLSRNIFFQLPLHQYSRPRLTHVGQHLADRIPSAKLLETVHPVPVFQIFSVVHPIADLSALQIVNALAIWPASIRNARIPVPELVGKTLCAELLVTHHNACAQKAILGIHFQDVTSSRVSLTFLIQ